MGAGDGSGEVNPAGEIAAAAAEFAEARAQFPALEKKVFLDAACMSLAPLCAMDAVARFMLSAAMCPAASATENHIAFDELRTAARREAAALVGAAEDEIALVESTTQALSTLAEALPLQRGDRVLIPDLEFLQVAVPWVQRRQRDGVEIDGVPHHNGQIRIADIEARLAPRTRVIAISTVQWSTGFRVDLAALAALCRARGVWLIADAVQQLGAAPISVQRTPVDVIACGGHKWLNAPFGCGFLYVRRERLAELSAVRRPPAGYLSLTTPAGGWGNYFQTPDIKPVREYEFVDEARRLETGGTANYPGAAGLAASLAMIRGLGQERIASHIFELTERLMAGLDRQGLEVVTPRAPESRSGIVTFSVGDAAANAALMEKLLAEKILVSVRYTSGVGGVRVSCHFFNSASDIDRLLDATARALRGA